MKRKKKLKLYEARFLFIKGGGEVSSLVVDENKTKAKKRFKAFWKLGRYRPKNVRLNLKQTKFKHYQNIPERKGVY